MGWKGQGVRVGLGVSPCNNTLRTLLLPFRNLRCVYVCVTVCLSMLELLVLATVYLICSLLINNN